MGTLLWAECRKLRRSGMVWLGAFGVIMVVVTVFLGGRSMDYGFSYIDDEGWYMNMVQPWATLFVLPGMTALFGSYIICREEQEDTMKSLELIPVDEGRLTAAKMMVAFGFCVVCYLLLFAITFLGEAVLHLKVLSWEMVLDFFRMYLIEGVGVFLAVSPIIALVAYMKRSYWMGLVLAEIYSFTGLFMSMSNVPRTFYPISAVFGVSGYYDGEAWMRMGSAGVLVLCGCISVLILRGLTLRKKCGTI